MGRGMTEMSMPHGTFSRQDIAVSLEESPGFSRGEDVKDAIILDIYLILLYYI